MYIIQSLALYQQLSFPTVVNIVRGGADGLIIVDGQSTGELLLPALSPRWITKWEGFELQPDEQGISVALINPSDEQPYAHSGTGWQSGAITYYTPDQIREWLPQWIGPLQIRLRLQRDASGKSPQLIDHKIGYHVPGDPLSYLLEVGLPAFLGEPVELRRWVQPSANGLMVPIPPGFEGRSLTEITIVSPEQPPQTGTLSNNQIILSDAIPTTRPARLLFKFKPLVEYASTIYQIREAPCILLQIVSGSRYRRVAAVDSIRLAGNMSRLWRTTYSYNQEIAVIVPHQKQEDGRAIAHHLMQKIESIGRIELPPFGTEIPMQVTQPVRMQPTPDDIVQGDLMLNSMFRFTLLNLTEGEVTQDVPTITEIQVEHEPSPT